jgi:ADP-ribose pyrophosphatase
MSLEKKILFSTPWFDVVAKSVPGEEQPYYCLVLADYVCALATTPQNELVVVRQFRPVIETHTLELPSGHVDPGETPESAARRELLEETGYEAHEMETLSVPLFSDTGRLANRIWCYRAKNVHLTHHARTPEAGIETLLLTPHHLGQKVKSGEFIHALHLAVLFLGDFHVE